MEISNNIEFKPIKVLRNEQYLAVAHSILDLTRKSVIICSYKFEISKRADARGLNMLIEKVCGLAMAGVSVKVLLDTTRQAGGLAKLNLFSAGRLKQYGIEFRTLPDRRCQHAKILLVDDSPGIIGSHNWSPKSMTENFEASVLIHSRALLEDIKEHFLKIWEKSIPI